MRKLKNFFAWLFKQKDCTLQCECGHETKMKKEVTINGEKSTLHVKYHPFKKVPLCLDCIEKMTIICPWCNKPIFIGDYITLYKPASPNFTIPKGSKIYSNNPLLLVGCQRSSCADTGADYCGIWDIPGKVRRFPSAIELALRTGKPVISNFK